MRFPLASLVAALGVALSAAPVADAGGVPRAHVTAAQRSAKARVAKRRKAPVRKAPIRKASRRKAAPPSRLRPARQVKAARLRQLNQAAVRISGRLPSQAETARFLRDVIARERRFYQPGVSYDAETGLTFDGHPIHAGTGRLRGAPRNWSAASKESLHIALLAKAVAGDPTARALVTPDPLDPDAAVPRALEVLERKIDTYRRFHERNPGFAGFLPWFKVERGEMVPMDGWTDRVPGLDNGQLAWSLYMAEGVLREQGYGKLADAYRDHMRLMADNVVKVFYDPAAQHFRGEAFIGRGGAVPPARNRYRTQKGGYHIKDAYEGLMLVHFADQMGVWRGQEAGREAVWRDPRRRPATKKFGRKEVTVVEGQFFGSHEEWEYLVLPTRDVPIADRLFQNGQRVRTQHSARRGYSGLFAPTHEPVAEGEVPEGGLAYVNSNGVDGVSELPVRTGKPIFAPYAAFPLALVDTSLFAGWMKSMLSRPGMLGPYGIGESYSEDGSSAPLLTWDGKALPMIALLGGVSGDVRRFLQRDGKYEAFLAREKADYRLFDGQHISGDDVPFAAPPPARARR